MAFTPQGFIPDPEHVEAATITPNNPKVSAAALADADQYAKPHTAADDNAPALEPGQAAPAASTTPAPSSPPAQNANFVPAGFKPDVTNNTDSSDQLGYHPGEAAMLMKAGLPQDRAIELAKKSYASTDNSDPWAPMSRNRQLVAAAMSALMGAPGMIAGEAPAAYQAGRFSMQRLNTILAEDAGKVADAAQKGTKIPPFQEWGRIAETLSDNPKTVSALQTLWSDPKYKLVRWATLAALTGGGVGSGLAKYMVHRALYDAVVQ